MLINGKSCLIPLLKKFFVRSIIIKLGQVHRPFHKIEFSDFSDSFPWLSYIFIAYMYITANIIVMPEEEIRCIFDDN